MTGIILFIVGTGPVRGFAITLTAGVVLSMFTAVVVTRFLMKQIVALGVKNVKLFTAVRAEKEEQE